MAGVVSYIFICPVRGQPMQSVQSVRAITGLGLEGDRYSTGDGSWNRDRPGSRQVTLINLRSFNGTGFFPADSRRNIVVNGMELMPLIGKYFRLGGVLMLGVKYCEPCHRPDKLSGKDGFQDQFCDRGGLLAEVVESGVVSVNDSVLVL